VVDRVALGSAPRPARSSCDSRARTGAGAIGGSPASSPGSRRIYVLFFIDPQSRRLHLAGLTENPDGAWVAQQARNLAWSLSERERPLRFLIHES
jgi:hypothetical protein